MKNKKNLYVLIPAVVLVWSLVIYKFFNGINGSVEVESKREQVTDFKPKKLKEATTFTIDGIYRDPFLGTFAKKKVTKARKVVKKQQQTPEVPFPQISYKGLVSPKGSNDKVFLISINGNQQLFKLKNTLQEITLLKGNEKEVLLQFQKQKRTFQIEK